MFDINISTYERRKQKDFIIQHISTLQTKTFSQQFRAPPWNATRTAKLWFFLPCYTYAKKYPFPYRVTALLVILLFKITVNLCNRGCIYDLPLASDCIFTSFPNWPAIWREGHHTYLNIEEHQHVSLATHMWVQLLWQHWSNNFRWLIKLNPLLWVGWIERPFSWTVGPLSLYVASNAALPYKFINFHKI